MASGDEAPAMSMKLFVDGDARRVVSAEAGKDVVDFLFSLRALPLGSVSGGGTAGSVGNLYASVERLDMAFVQPGSADRESPLHPTVLSPPARTDHSFHPRLELYSCPTVVYTADCIRNVTDARGTRCPSCGDEMTAVARYVPPTPCRKWKAGAGDEAGAPGFVRGGATRSVVKDDLTVLGVALFTALGVGDVATLEEKDVELGLKEVAKTVIN